MDKREILAHVDHTLLKAAGTWEEIRALCEEGIANQVASVCIPPSYVARVAEKYGKSVNICTVIGFPLGYSTTEAKVFEARRAIQDGAAEVDMVVNLGDVKNGDDEKVLDEIRRIKEAVGDRILKVIVETCYLTEAEKIRLCDLVTRSGADYIKTSTGFGSGGATLSDIELFRKHVGSDVKMKAAGGIRSRESMEAFLNLGCERIGTSSAVSVLKDE